LSVVCTLRRIQRTNRVRGLVGLREREKPMRIATALWGLCWVSAIGVDPAAAQERQERWRFLDPATVLSDDPRRVPASPVPRGPDRTLVLIGGRIFDGTGQEAFEGTLVIERNRIAEVLPPEATNWPADAHVVDVSGRTVMPGLIDLHGHLSYPFVGAHLFQTQSAADQALRGAERLRYFVESGVTSVRDVASHGDVVFRLKEWVARNRIPGPRVFAAGQLITATGGHGAERLDHTAHLYGVVREASGPDDWREAVREQFKRGADLIKVASHFSREEVEAAVAEAHALGIKVTCDCETFYIPLAIEAGVDMIEHPLPRDDSVYQLMAERGVTSDPTLIIVQLVWDMRGGYFGSTSRRFTWSPESSVEVARRMRQAGVVMGVGLDLIWDTYRLLPEPYIRELELFVEIGYTVPEALVAATATSAELLDMGDLLGTLETGKLADVLVVHGAPDQRLHDLARVDLVIRDGHVVVENGRARLPDRWPMDWPTPPPLTADRR
jgi:imidazolonepropionase-like amidohydrolase